MIRHLAKSKAFTLIELLIVIAIILLMATAAIPAYQNYGAKQEVTMKAEEIKALIDRAEAYSKNPAQNNNCAMVNLAADPITIQFGNFDATACSASSSSSQFSTKDMVDTRGFTITRTDDINNLFAYYTGGMRLRNSAEGYVPQATITVGSPRTPRVATITIFANPYRTEITIAN